MVELPHVSGKKLEPMEKTTGVSSGFISLKRLSSSLFVSLKTLGKSINK